MSCKICLHTTYEAVELALVHTNFIKDVRSIPKEKASAELIVTIDQLLKENALTLADIDFLIVNQGPAPFTTLRTIITTANGIAFATGIQLIGVDALQSFAYACTQVSDLPIVVMLNAFNKAVYYGIQTSSINQLQTGCMPIQEFIALLKISFDQEQKFQVCGNGANLYLTELKDAFAHQIVVERPIKLVPSIEDIIAYASLNECFSACASSSLEPLYLKKSI